VAGLIETSGEQGDFGIPIEVIAHTSLGGRRQAA
jgi:hypothetical protein